MTPLEWSLAAAEVPASPREFKREATPAELAAVAKALGLLGCARLTANYRLRPLGGGRYKLTGQCEADVTQACIVSLEPVPASVTLPIDVEFAPDGVAPLPDTDEVEVLTLPDVEPIEQGQLHVGRVVYEVLAAGLDPYPRKEGAAFAWEDPKAESSTVHPFAVLAKLKTTS
jgi:uncharacterized metal-binding protein YceD (DUF177 family)